ncbi:MAG TPA: BatD family protein [Saprospiraceae bacterium]|nr:BatD family protein [Saprospiraceae bacterium]HMQ81990.1 BatD family protein [Saprospiraceae bacterium]
MKRTKKATLLFLLLLSHASAFSQGNVAFFAETDARQVVKNSYFDVSFTLQNANGSNFISPAFQDFIIVAGPSRSTRTTMVNGVMSQSMSFIYTLQPRKTGKFTLGPASIEVKGKRLKTNSITIEVVEGKEAEQEVFIVAELSTEKAWVGQQVILDYKLYTSVDIESFNILEESDYQGFFAQDVRRFDGRVIKEVINGVQYVTKVLKRVALFPQQAGQLTISPLNVQLGILKDGGARRRSFFSTPEVRRMPISTEAVSLEVRSLPADSPPVFSGAVGSFQMTAAVSQDRVTTDDAITLTLAIAGDGDIKRVQAPALEIPEGLELYDPKILDESFYESGTSFAGKKVFEYILLPKTAGEYQISPAFSYFDPDSAQYVVVQNEPIALSVRPGINNSAAVEKTDPGSKQSITELQAIKSDTELSQMGRSFFASPLFWILGLLPFALLAGWQLFKQWQFQKGQISQEETRFRQAKKTAQKRLAQAEAYQKAGESRSFYDEISKALFGYLCDKLHIPLSGLNKANVAARLRSEGFSETLIEQLMEVFQKCELALFAGKSDEVGMAAVYEKASDAISKLELGKE